MTGRPAGPSQRRAPARISSRPSARHQGAWSPAYEAGVHINLLCVLDQLVAKLAVVVWNGG
jgi:hypothetical protein